MSALLKKEFRLLLPAWIAAMLLALLPAMLSTVLRYDAENMGQLTFFTGALGCLILGTVGFGREFESRTFALLLAQPWQRREFWRAKITVLVVSLLPLGLWMLAFDIVYVPHKQQWIALWLWLAAAVALVTGGLWTSLLLRQFFSAFWISVLLPLGIVMSAIGPFVEDISEELGLAITFAILIAYSVAGYFFARRLFRTAQDTQWTGGEVSLSAIAKWLRWTRATGRPKRTHPLWALLRKEFHLHESSLIAAVLLFVAQIAALVLARCSKNPQASTLGVLPTMVWMLWLVIPALVGCAGVAEERKLGTFESQLCLPVSRARQFVVKLLVTLALGTALGTVVPMGTAPLQVAEKFQGAGWAEFAGGWTLACLGITIVCFYASSLTRYALHAFAVAIAFALVWTFLGNWLNGEFLRAGGDFRLFGWVLWHGPLAFFVGPLVMLLFAAGYSWRRLRWIWLGIIALVALAFQQGIVKSFFERMYYQESHAKWEEILLKTMMILVFTLGPTLLLLVLAARNFQSARTTKFLWLRNGATWTICLLLTMIVTTLAYNRVWDFRKPFEPPAGPRQLTGSVKPSFASAEGGDPTFLLLPDGRLCFYKWYEPPYKPPKGIGNSTRRVGGLIANPRVEFLEGSNWVAIAALAHELVAVRSDGSLWRVYWNELVDSESRAIPFHLGMRPQPGQKLRAIHPKFERMGSDSDWKTVAASPQHFIALKRDGTIWGWGGNANKQSGDGPKIVTNAPIRIGNKSDWANVFAGSDCSFGVKSDESVWKWGRVMDERWQTSNESEPSKLNVNLGGIRQVISQSSWDVILDDSGKLWAMGVIPWSFVRTSANTHGATTPYKVPDSNWSVIASADFWQIAGIKQDGTLWQLAEYDRNRPVTRRRHGERADWIAARIEGDSIVALAKDGAICRFGQVSVSAFWRELLAPIRRVTWSVNVLDAASDSLK